MDPNKVERSSEKKEAKIFFTKDEIVLPSKDSIYISKGNEVIFFRPTEFDFGLRLEDTQDKSLLDLDGDFEELTNEVIDAFKTNKNIKISICEKPMIAIAQANETLYFNTSKELYGIIFCKKGVPPIFKLASEKNIIEQIKTTYNL